MPHRDRSILALSCGLLILLPRIALAADFTSARVAVYFSPNSGATAAVVQEVHSRHAADPRPSLRVHLGPHCPSLSGRPQARRAGLGGARQEQ
jgi:hypothetical protein